MIAAGKVYWLATTYGHPETTRLESWDLARRANGASVPAPDATGLVSYGSGVALIRAVGSHTTLTNGAGEALAKAQLDAAADGDLFGYDGAGTLSWMRKTGFPLDGRVGYSAIQLGKAGVRNDELVPLNPDGGVWRLPFVRVEAPHHPEYKLLDLRTRPPVKLPAGTTVLAVAGQTVIFGIGDTKVGAAGLSAVALSDLPPVRC